MGRHVLARRCSTEISPTGMDGWINANATRLLSRTISTTPVPACLVHGIMPLCKVIQQTLIDASIRLRKYDFVWMYVGAEISAVAESINFRPFHVAIVVRRRGMNRSEHHIHLIALRPDESCHTNLGVYLPQSE